MFISFFLCSPFSLLCYVLFKCIFNEPDHSLVALAEHTVAAYAAELSAAEKKECISIQVRARAHIMQRNQGE